MTPRRIVCHFSCGAASAVATKLAIRQYGHEATVIYNVFLREEHSDNRRFAADCERWFGHPITVLHNPQYADRGARKRSNKPWRRSRMPRSWRLTPPKLKLVENDVEGACLDLLRYRGFWPVRQHCGKFRTADDRWITLGQPGLPDWALVKRPGFLLEVKRPGGKLSEIQEQRIAELRQWPDLDVVVVESVEELMDWLSARERSP
jgi:hypothetical protein